MVSAERLDWILEEVRKPYGTPNQGGWNDEVRIAFRGGPVQFRLYCQLKYGTNPHGKAAILVEEGHDPLFDVVKQGKGGASETNWDDVNEGLILVRMSEVVRPGKPCAVVLKHLNQCGDSIGEVHTFEEQIDVYKRARSADRQAAFGGTVVVNYVITPEHVHAMKGFSDNLAAPGFTAEALDLFRSLEKKDKLRVFEYDQEQLLAIDPFSPHEIPVVKPYFGGRMLRAGTVYHEPVRPENMGFVVTDRDPTEDERQQLLFAWYAAASLRSNGVGLVKDFNTVAAGTGQQKRNGAIEQAIHLARTSAEYRNEDPDAVLRGAVLGSDGFLPNVDNIEPLVEREITAIIQPGGSGVDRDVIDACNEAGIAMLMTGNRCFKH